MEKVEPKLDDLVKGWSKDKIDYFEDVQMDILNTITDPEKQMRTAKVALLVMLEMPNESFAKPAISMRRFMTKVEGQMRALQRLTEQHAVTTPSN